MFSKPIELSDKEFIMFRELIYEQSGINLGENKKELVRTRLGKILRKGGYSSFKEYFDFVVEDSSGQEIMNLLNAISTNLTSFYRESKHFDYLAKTLLPNIITEKNAKKTKQIRAWSAGCSTGEEPYTIALTIVSNIDNIANWDIKMLATDISTKVLQIAQTGIYHKDKLKDVPMDQFKKYFSKADSDPKSKFYEISDDIKNIIRFRRLNLIMPSYPFKGLFDFIFCRNVMIYFDRKTQQELINRYYEYLEPGGVLFVGHSESLTGITHKFKYVMPTVYRKEV